MRLIDADKLKEKSPTELGAPFWLIDDMPTIDPVTHGHWKNVRKEAIIPTGECSRCGKWERVNNFCPNCGAKMDEEET